MLKVRLLAAILIISAIGSQVGAQQRGKLLRSVKNNILTSSEFPDIQVRLDKAFRYVGKFDFTIENIARGERYVFVDSKGRNVRRMFIFQFEEIIPESKETYNYSFRDALNLGGHKFRHGTYAYSNKEARRNDPKKEAALTADFLEKKGYVIDDEYMMSRFVTVPDAERKHELILFYLEAVSPTGHRLEEFYKDGEATPIWREISPGLTKRSHENFTVLK
jgi:hypothetical protein